MSDDTQRIGWDVFELSEYNTARNCTDRNCDRNGRFYVHEFGYSCEEHLPDGASPLE